jgi:hypothetical protein
MSETEQPDIFAVLGEFVNTFANIEVLWHMFFRKLTGMDDRVARVVCEKFGNHEFNLKIREILNIPDLAKSNKVAEEKKLILDTLKKYDEICVLRNQICHRWAWVFPDAIQATNAMKEIRPSGRKGSLLPGATHKLTDILGASKDLAEIGRRLQWLLNPKNGWTPNLSRAWLYTLAPQDNKKKPRHRSRQ